MMRYHRHLTCILLLLISISMPMAMAANHAPVIEPVPELKTKVGEHLVVQLEGSDPDPGDEANLTWGLVYGPGGLTISESGLLDWTPRSVYSGYQTFQVSLSDGKSTTTKTCVITVDKADPPPGTPIWALVLEGVCAVIIVVSIITLSIMYHMKYGWHRTGWLRFIMDKKK